MPSYQRLILGKKKTLEQRVEELEEFHKRVKLGQKWALCALAGVGSLVGFCSYVLSTINQWDVWKHSH